MYFYQLSLIISACPGVFFLSQHPYISNLFSIRSGGLVNSCAGLTSRVDERSVPIASSNSPTRGTASSPHNSHWSETLLLSATGVKPPGFLIAVSHYQDLAPWDMCELKKQYYYEQYLKSLQKGGGQLFFSLYAFTQIS